jgi:hypothetical protein
MTLKSHNKRSARARCSRLNEQICALIIAQQTADLGTSTRAVIAGLQADLVRERAELEDALLGGKLKP